MRESLGSYNPTFYRAVRALVKQLFFGPRGGLYTVGEENLPKTGGVILAPNHVSHLDPPAACCALKRTVHCMAKEELFSNKLFGRMITMLAAFPVRRGEGDTEAIRTAISLLEQGEVVLLFPEGTRGDGERIQPINRGVGMIAKKSGVPVVPVAITGTEVVMPAVKGRKARRHRMTVAIGKPFTYEETSTGSNERENRDLFARRLRDEILGLCHQHGLPLRIDDSAPPRTGDGDPASSPESKPAESPATPPQH
jgi:1-acyl-sn-glycerol-3-phosphate acyltransferase